ncbi:MAG: iron-containing alcohol dehydrogenase [Christensenellales bacterium]
MTSTSVTGCSKTAAALLARCRGHRAMIVTDENVAPLYLDAMKAQLEAAGAQASAFVLPAGETTKCMAQLERIYDALIDAHITRQDFVVALGGGVVGDIAGYAALHSICAGCASFRRRRPFWRRWIPPSAGRWRSITRAAKTCSARFISRSW